MTPVHTVREEVNNDLKGRIVESRPQRRNRALPWQVGRFDRRRDRRIEADTGATPIVRIALPNDELTLLETVEQRGDRSGGQSRCLTGVTSPPATTKPESLVSASSLASALLWLPFVHET